MDFYDQVAATIRRRGWTQGVAEDRTGRVCLLKAMNLARLSQGHIYEGSGDPWQPLRSTLCDPVPDDFAQKLRTVTAVINEQYPDRTALGTSIVRFNDHPDTVEDDLYAVLDKAKAQ